MSEHVLDRLSAFLDEELPAREQSAVEGHLRDCSDCAAQLERLRSVDAQARALPLSVPDGYFEALPGRIRKRLEMSSRPAHRRVPVWTWAVAAALVLGVVTPLTMQRGGPASDAMVPAAAPTYPPPVAGAVAPAERETPADAALARGKAKDDRAEPKVQAPLAEATSADRLAAAPPPAPSAALEAPSKKEVDARSLEALGYLPASAPASSPSRARAVPQPAPGGPYAQQQAPLAAAAAPEFADAPVEAPQAAGAAPPAGERRADRNEASRDEELAKQQSPALRRSTEGVAASGRVSSAASSSDERVFRLLKDATAPTTLAALRERREAWRSFTRDFPASPRADEARVRVVEIGAEAWRMSRDSADLVRVHEDAAAYLARRDAARAGSVRAVLESLPARP